MTVETSGLSSSDISRIVQTELERLFNNSPALRGYYLLCRRNVYTWPPFSPEDLAQFVIWLLLNNFQGLGDVSPIPEIIIRYLIGDIEFVGNIIQSAVSKNFFEGKSISMDMKWEEFYYLKFLPSNKLFHLTTPAQKSHAGSMCERMMLESERLSIKKAVKHDMTNEPLSVFDFDKIESISKFASMRSIQHKHGRSFSVTICGFHRSMMGLGEDARNLFDMLTDLGYRVELFDCSPPGLERDPTADYYEIFETKKPCAEVTIFCMPVFEMARIISMFSRTFFSERYIVGYWPWELSEFPIGWSELMDLANEVWASTTFLKSVYQQACQKPVYHVPLCVEIGDCHDEDTAKRYIPSGSVTFLTVFDFNSTVQRKNPIGAVKAFKRAFADININVKLLLKSLHGQANREQLNVLLKEIGDDARISLLDGPLTRATLNGIIARSSALLSLHRSEGFGRLLVEAMLLETPVVATNWSGSRDFICSETAFPVACHLRPVGTAEYPYAAGIWAEPDLNDAARILRLIASSETKCDDVVANALSSAISAFSRDAVKKHILDRMTAIERLLANRA